MGEKGIQRGRAVESICRDAGNAAACASFVESCERQHAELVAAGGDGAGVYLLAPQEGALFPFSSYRSCLRGARRLARRYSGARGQLSATARRRCRDATLPLYCGLLTQHCIDEIHTGAERYSLPFKLGQHLSTTSARGCLRLAERLARRMVPKKEIPPPEAVAAVPPPAVTPSPSAPTPEPEAPAPIAASRITTEPLWKQTERTMPPILAHLSEEALCDVLVSDPLFIDSAGLREFNDGTHCRYTVRRMSFEGEGQRCAELQRLEEDFARTRAHYDRLVCRAMRHYLSTAEYVEGQPWHSSFWMFEMGGRTLYFHNRDEIAVEHLSRGIQYECDRDAELEKIDTEVVQRIFSLEDPVEEEPVEQEEREERDAKERGLPALVSSSILEGFLDEMRSDQVDPLEALADVDVEPWTESAIIFEEVQPLLWNCEYWLEDGAFVGSGGACASLFIESAALRQQVVREANTEIRAVIAAFLKGCVTVSFTPPHELGCTLPFELRGNAFYVRGTDPAICIDPGNPDAGDANAPHPCQRYDDVMAILAERRSMLENVEALKMRMIRERLQRYSPYSLEGEKGMHGMRGFNEQLERALTE